jgi:hypothetical protein
MIKLISAATVAGVLALYGLQYWNQENNYGQN